MLREHHMFAVTRAMSIAIVGAVNCNVENSAGREPHLWALHALLLKAKVCVVIADRFGPLSHHNQKPPKAAEVLASRPGRHILIGHLCWRLHVDEQSCVVPTK